MKCNKCKLLEQVFPDGAPKNPRWYFLMTELFVFLHEGKDFCDYEKDMEKMNDIYKKVLKSGKIAFEDMGHIMKVITQYQPSSKKVNEAYRVTGGYQPTDKTDIKSENLEPPQGGTGEL